MANRHRVFGDSIKPGERCGDTVVMSPFRTLRSKASRIFRNPAPPVAPELPVLPDMPAEIWRHILRFALLPDDLSRVVRFRHVDILDKKEDPRPDPATLCSLLKVSKRFHALALEYHLVGITVWDVHQLWALWRTLRASPSYRDAVRQWVKTLKIYLQEATYDSLDTDKAWTECKVALVDVITTCANVLHLIVDIQLPLNNYLHGSVILGACSTFRTNLKVLEWYSDMPIDVGLLISTFPGLMELALSNNVELVPGGSDSTQMKHMHTLTCSPLSLLFHLNLVSSPKISTIKLTLEPSVEFESLKFLQDRFSNITSLQLPSLVVAALQDLLPKCNHLRHFVVTLDTYDHWSVYLPKITHFGFAVRGSDSILDSSSMWSSMLDMLLQAHQVLLPAVTVIRVMDPQVTASVRKGSKWRQKISKRMARYKDAGIRLEGSDGELLLTVRN